MKRLFLALIMAGTALTSSLALAGQATPAFMQPEVLKAALAIQLTEEQEPQFQSSITELFNERMKYFNKLMRGHNVTNMERKMRGKTNRLIKTMDKQMAEFLTDEQMPAYENYRDTLRSYMR